jgi:hypothetical protein
MPQQPCIWTAFSTGQFRQKRNYFNSQPVVRRLVPTFSDIGDGFFTPSVFVVGHFNIICILLRLIGFDSANVMMPKRQKAPVHSVRLPERT